MQIIALISALVFSITGASSLSIRSTYTQTFSNLTGATEAPDYLTYHLVDTLAQCEAFCDSDRGGCNFVNLFNDNLAHFGSRQFTCSLYTACHTAADATNVGGQPEGVFDGKLNYITNSAGYCRTS